MFEIVGRDLLCVVAIASHTNMQDGVHKIGVFGEARGTQELVNWNYICRAHKCVKQTTSS